MKNKFLSSGIPTVNFKIIKKNFFDSELKDLNSPYVVKPLDSQGQRGVFKLNSIAQIREKFEEVLSFSREEEILVEEYYLSDEITVSGWVKNGETHLLTVTDRLNFESDIHLGICSSHLFPSKYLQDYFREIKALSQKIVREFKLKNGPLYFQFLIGKKVLWLMKLLLELEGHMKGILCLF